MTPRVPATGRAARDHPVPAGGAARGHDRGSVTLELVIAFPTMLLLIFSLVQASLYYYARSLALAAAQEGVRGARVESGDLRDGVSRARSFLNNHAGDSLVSTAVTDTGSGPTQVRIRVSGRSLSVLPGVAGFNVTQEASGPKERFTSTGTP